MSICPTNSQKLQEIHFTITQDTEMQRNNFFTFFFFFFKYDMNM